MLQTTTTPLLQTSLNCFVLFVSWYRKRQQRKQTTIMNVARQLQTIATQYPSQKPPGKKHEKPKFMTKTATTVINT
jgi:hypothetical protein